MRTIGRAVATAAAASLLAPAAHAAQRTDAEAMVDPVAGGWTNTAIFTVGETVRGYPPSGLLDGTSAFPGNGRGTLRTYVNHEIREGAGYAYSLSNGTQLTGARISRFDLQSTTLKVVRAALAYDTVYDVDGAEVTDPDQVNPATIGEDGISRLCSARGVRAGEHGFVDEIHFAGEEQTNGLLWALDIAAREIHAVPAAGLLSWENVSPVETGDDDTVALLIGDDRQAAPLWLYVGTKGEGGFLERNGLADGQLYVWVADANDPAGAFDSPAEFSGNGTTASGAWAPVDARNADGSLRTTAELDAAADAVGHFGFSRPEDVHDNPANGQQLVLASTGRDSWDGASDRYGTTYLVDVSFDGGEPAGADLTILYDGDVAYATVGPDAMLRSPDNLTWASDGSVYVQEDRAVDADWGTVEASVWKLDPARPGWGERIAVIDRSAVPAGQVDTGEGVGAWETSGILDVTGLVHGSAGVSLLYDVQAHGLLGGAIDALDLVEGGQLGLLRSGS